jgi:nucleotide-binding universal stress UspA family protein
MANERAVAEDVGGDGTTPLRHVLAAVALGEDSAPVIAAAAALARSAGGRLTVVHVEEPAATIGELAAMVLGDRAGALEGRLSALVEPEASRAGVAWESRVVRGGTVPHRAVVEEAGRLGAGLVVVGATRRGRGLGSTAERVVRKAWCPVLVVRAGMALPPRRVVAPVDLSELSGRGFRDGLELVRALGDGHTAVVALFAVGYLDPPAAEMRREGFGEDEMVARARGRLDAFVAAHGPEGLAIESRVVCGPAAEEVLRAAREQPTDLIAMATHGRGGFERLLLGSVAGAVVREAPCSVLLLPPQAARAAAASEALLGGEAAG